MNPDAEVYSSIEAILYDELSDGLEKINFSGAVMPASTTFSVDYY
jgi:hypothetical protein